MPGIAQTTGAGVGESLRMPFAYAGRDPVIAQYLGPSARQAHKEAQEALKRIVRASSFWLESARRRAILAPMLDPESGAEALREYAAGQGVNLDTLLAEASRHFSS